MSMSSSVQSVGSNGSGSQASKKAPIPPGALLRGDSVTSVHSASASLAPEPETGSNTVFGKTIQNRIPIYGQQCYALNAIRSGDYNLFLKELNKDINRLNDQYPSGWYGGNNHLLHVAVYFNRYDIVEKLLDLGAILECRTSFQYTPLMISCVNGYSEIACLLVERGADRTLMDCNNRSCDDLMSDNVRHALIEHFRPKTPELKEPTPEKVFKSKEEEIEDERRRIKIKFDEADVDGSGELDAEELAAFCETLGTKLSPEELEAALLILDESGDGQISYEEFAEWWLEDQ
jgi:hypothetical protein